MEMEFFLVQEYKMDPSGNQVLSPKAPGVELWHVRFDPAILSRVKEWVDKHSARYVIAYETLNKDKTPTRPHHHMFFETALGESSIRKIMKGFAVAEGLQVAKGKANAYYGGVQVCSDTSYVCKFGDYTATKGYLEQTLKDLQAEGAKKYIREIPIVATNPVVGGVTYGSPAKKSISMKAQFVRYMETEQQWRENFTISAMSHDQRMDELVDHLTEFWKNAFTTPQGVVCIEHARWYFADDDVKESIRLKNRFAIKKSLR